MGTYRFDRLFDPRSVALIGGSPRVRSVGRAVLANLKNAGFPNPIGAINSKYAEIEGIATVKTLSDLPFVPDVVIVTAPAASVPGLIAEVGSKGSAAAIVLTAGLGHGVGSLADAAEKTARANGVRIVGPNCLGMMVPGRKLNASFAARFPAAGNLALISQSGAIAAGLVEWAASRSIGFSAIVSIGDQLDVDIGDLLDHFALDPGTRAILLYVEAIKNARKFMSAARAAARVKPVVVVKAGRHARGASAARTHTGALAGVDEVYDAAFRRAGLLRVFDLKELFAAAETLGRVRDLAGKRLAILTNGGGVGVLAVDRLMDVEGALATISPDAMAKLDAVLPRTWSGANPVDIAGDADASRYSAALDVLLSDRDNDAVLVMNVATALASPLDAARAVAESVRKHRRMSHPPKPVFSVWVGDQGEAAHELESAGIPHYPGESEAIAGFSHLVRYREARKALMEIPPSLPQDFTPNVRAARAIVSKAIAEKRSWLDPVELNEVLGAYAIPFVPVLLAAHPEAAVSAAAPFLDKGQLVALKIHSPDIIHKTDVGGVRLNLATAVEVRQAAREMLDRIRTTKPAARITGVTVHPMVMRPGARELIAGIADDPIFGPIVVFGGGGTTVEVVNDKALALPPLDLRLADDLIKRTRVSRLLDAYRNIPPADRNALALVLVKLAQLVADVPEIREIDLNPLLGDQAGVMVVDARIAVSQLDEATRRGSHPRFAIRPYPKEWEHPHSLVDGTDVLVRPIRPEDEPLYAAFFAQVSSADMRLRFFAPIKEFSHVFIARLTQLDYARAMAFVAIRSSTGELLGVGRLHANANYDEAEYAVLVRSDFKGRGLGRILMQTILCYARSEGMRRVEGQVLRENAAMLTMCRDLGFSVSSDRSDPSSCLVQIDLNPNVETNASR